jgi:hypothetical protein
MLGLFSFINEYLTDYIKFLKVDDSKNIHLWRGVLADVHLTYLSSLLFL